MRSFRSKPVGWRNESYRHYLAAKGVRTSYMKLKQKYQQGILGFLQVETNKFYPDERSAKAADDKHMFGEQVRDAHMEKDILDVVYGVEVELKKERDSELPVWLRSKEEVGEGVERREDFEADKLSKDKAKAERRSRTRARVVMDHLDLVSFKDVSKEQVADILYDVYGKRSPSDEVERVWSIVVSVDPEKVRRFDYGFRPRDTASVGDFDPSNRDRLLKRARVEKKEIDDLAAHFASKFGGDVSMWRRIVVKRELKSLKDRGKGARGKFGGDDGFVPQ